MRKEVKEVIWHSKNEYPDVPFADVLVRVLETSKEKDEHTRVFHEIWQWFDVYNMHVPRGFYHHGNLVNDTTHQPLAFRVLDFEWCYLSRCEDGEEKARPVF